MPALTAEEMEKRYGGKDYLGVSIVKFLYAEKGYGRSTNWTVVAKCICGREFECKFDSLRRSKKPLSCGCRSMKGRYDRSEAAAKRLQKTNHRSSPMCDAVGTLSRLRLVEYWERMPVSDCCKAWQVLPDKFIEWAIRNGYHKAKKLIRIDETKPFSPMNARWEFSK